MKVTAAIKWSMAFAKYEYENEKGQKPRDRDIFKGSFTCQGHRAAKYKGPGTQQGSPWERTGWWH